MGDSEAATSASSFGRKKRKPDSSVEVPPNSVSVQNLSAAFKDKRLRVSEDRMTVSNSGGGYGSICASTGSSSGSWYFEVNVEELSPGAFFRVGWSTRRTRFDCPIGSDCFSCAVRSKDGRRVILGKVWPGAETEAFKVGDVIGCSVKLASLVSPHAAVGGSNLLCDPENVSECQTGEGAAEFFLNGIPIGHTIVNLPVGEYYPAISLMGKCKVRFDFEPKCPPGTNPAANMYVCPELARPRKRPPNFIPRGLAN